MSSLEPERIDYDFKIGQYVIYQNGDRVELGKIKSLRAMGAFVWYHSGETAALTDYADLKPIVNDYCITETLLGGAIACTEDAMQRLKWT